LTTVVSPSVFEQSPGTEAYVRNNSHDLLLHRGKLWTRVEVGTDKDQVVELWGMHLDRVFSIVW